MTFVSDLIKGGYWPLQHQETKTVIGNDWQLQRRLLRFGCRVKHVRGQKRIVQQGPISGGLVFDTKNSKAYPNIWSFAAPSAPNGSGQVSLVKGPKWSETVSGVETMTPAFNNEQQYPAGWSAVTLAGVDFDKQNELALAGFDGIVAPHFENIPKLGTPVWELKGRALGARARFQSLSRLYEPPKPAKCLNWGDGNHLALQLGRSTDGAGYLVMADDPDKLTTGGLQDLGTGNKRGGGPFDVGGGACPHIHGVNARGETMRALHLTTSTLFRGGVGDGPLFFKNKIYDQNVFDAPFKRKVEIVWNPEALHTWGCGVANGIWEPQSESFFSLIIPPKPPSTPLDPIPKAGQDGFGGGDGSGPAFPVGPVTPGGLPRELSTPSGANENPFPEVPFFPRGPIGLGPLPPGLATPSGLFRDPPGDEGNPFEEGEKDEAPRDLYIPPGLFGGDRIIGPLAQPVPLYGTSVEMAFPALVGRAQHYTKKKHDLRNVGKSLSDEQRTFWACEPATIRSEFFAAQRADVFEETQDKKSGRYQNVPTANGGRVNMPPELGLEYLIDCSPDLTGLNYSTTYDVYWKTRQARGTPVLCGEFSGGVKNGFSDYYDETTECWATYHHNENGAGTLVREYDAQGRDRKLCIATYGDGNDGNATLTTQTLSAVKHYDNLTVATGAVTTAKSVIIHVKNTLTINNNGYLSANGADGATGTGGGVGGSGASELWYGTSGTGGDGGNNGAGNAGESLGASIGGSGGAGGDGAGGANAGGAAGASTAPTHFPRALESILHGQDRDLTGYRGGSSGGGAGSGAGVQGPGGGAGGGVMVIVARHLILHQLSSCFRAIGGDGGDGGTTDSGGGGGGGGGFVCLIYQTAETHDGAQLSESEVAALIDVSGGSGGIKEGSDKSTTNGADGSDGVAIVLKHG